MSNHELPPPIMPEPHEVNAPDVNEMESLVSLRRGVNQWPDETRDMLRRENVREFLWKAALATVLVGEVAGIVYVQKIADFLNSILPIIAH